MTKHKDEYTYNYIYKITNNLTGEYYIGAKRTDLTPEEDKNYYGGGKALLRAFKEHGRKNFRKTILEQGFATPDDLFARERELVNEDTVNDPKCYNILYGGKRGAVYPPDTRKRMSELLTGIKKRPRTDEHRKNLSISLKETFRIKREFQNAQ